MISHSPPIFSHSPPVSFLSEYMNNNRHQTINYNDEQNRASRYCRPKVITLASKIMVNNASNIANSVNNCENNTINSYNTNNANHFNSNNKNNLNSVLQKQQLQQQQNQRALTFLSNNFNNNNVNNNNNNISTFLSATEKRINGLERMTSVPNLPLLPKSCLMRKKCQHKCVPTKTISPTPTDKSTATTTTTTIANNNSNNNNNNNNNSSASFNIGDDENNKSTNESENNHAICELCRSRKKVIFADDEGLALTEVRVMSEPSNVPPYWSMKFLEQITQGLVTPQPADQWTVDFKQPASDYLKFRQKIENSLVSLENVIVKDEESIVVGTVKVKNIAFEKEVVVRVTWDDWRSQQDIFCTYARAYGPQTCAHVVFDTFSFKIILPPSSKRLEFCICYRTNNKEYWDNNNGQNYTITKRSPFYYNALSPYEKNSSRQSGAPAQIMSTLTEALANGNQQSRNNRQETLSPYW